MATVPVRGLRNHTADVIARVRSGEDVTITANGVPVATLEPISTGRPETISRGELRLILMMQADAGLRDDLASLSGETTDDLGPVE